MLGTGKQDAFTNNRRGAKAHNYYMMGYAMAAKGCTEIHPPVYLSKACTKHMQAGYDKWHEMNVKKS